MYVDGYRHVFRQENQDALDKGLKVIAASHPLAYRAFHLRHIECLSRTQAAEEMGLSHRPQTISELCKIAKSELRKLLGSMHDYELF